MEILQLEEKTFGRKTEISVTIVKLWDTAKQV